jgi:hypothetical protein
MKWDTILAWNTTRPTVNVKTTGTVYGNAISGFI